MSVAHRILPLGITAKNYYVIKLAGLPVQYPAIFSIQYTAG
jgi:hypothetical protein